MSLRDHIVDFLYIFDVVDVHFRKKNIVLLNCLSSKPKLLKKKVQQKPFFIDGMMHQLNRVCNKKDPKFNALSLTLKMSPII